MQHSKRKGPPRLYKVKWRQPPPNVRWKRQDQAVEKMLAWFRSNFRQSTPYGLDPYSADLWVRAAFRNARPRAIAAAVAILDDEGAGLWEPISEGWPYWRDSQLRLELIDRVDNLADGLKRATEGTSLMGDNDPPERLDSPLSKKDRQELLEALLALQHPLPRISGGNVQVSSALATIDSKREKISKWLVDMGAEFTHAAAKEAGKQFGKWGPVTFWVWILDQMIGLSKLVQVWLKVLAQ